MPTPDKSAWTAPQWQAHLAAIHTLEGRREALHEVPEEWRVRVKHHLMTVFAIKKYHSKRKGAKSRRLAR